MSDAPSLPILSFVVPVHSAQPFVAEALDSIVAQGLRPDEYEIVVVDNHGDVATLERVRDWIAGQRIDARVIGETNRGAGHARNAGVAAARGAWIHFLDADDVIAPDTVRPQVGILVGCEPTLACVHSEWAEWNGGTAIGPARLASLRPAPEDCVLDLVSPSGFVAMGSYLLRREAFLEVGGFSDAEFLEDVDLYLRLSFAGRTFRPHALGRPKLLYRQSQANTARRFSAAFAQAMLRNARSVHQWKASKGLLDDETRRAVARIYFEACRALVATDREAFGRADEERRILGLDAPVEGSRAFRYAAAAIGFGPAARLAHAWSRGRRGAADH